MGPGQYPAPGYARAGSIPGSGFIWAPGSLRSAVGMEADAPESSGGSWGGNSPRGRPKLTNMMFSFVWLQARHVKWISQPSSAPGKPGARSCTDSGCTRVVSECRSQAHPGPIGPKHLTRQNPYTHSSALIIKVRPCFGLGALRWVQMSSCQAAPHVGTTVPRGWFLNGVGSGWREGCAALIEIRIV